MLEVNDKKKKRLCFHHWAQDFTPKFTNCSITDSQNHWSWMGLWKLPSPRAGDLAQEGVQLQWVVQDLIIYF